MAGFLQGWAPVILRDCIKRKSKNNNMRVLHIVASLSSEWGGPPRVVQGLTEALARRGVEVSIFVPLRRGEENSLIYPKGVEVKTFKESLPVSRIWRVYSPAFAKALNKEIFGFDLIHIHEIWHHSHFVAYRAAKKSKKPFIITPHGALEPWCLKWKYVKKKIFAALIQKSILKEANVLHALTQREAKDIKSFVGDNKIAVIPNGISPEEFQNLPLPLEIEKKYPELTNKKVILFLGRIHPKKGLDILAEAFGKIVGNRKDICLFVAGPDNNGYQEKIKSILAKNNVLDKVIFSGALGGKDRLAALSRADMFVLPSYSEGFSMTILEAMVCRLPVIITNQCNFPEVRENEAGLVINPSTDELVKAITKLLENSALSKEMGENGRKLVLEKFTWDKIADKMINLYKNAIKGKINN